MWKSQSWYDYFFKYNPDLNIWQNNFLIFYKPKKTLENFLIDWAYVLEDTYLIIFGDFFSRDYWRTSWISEYLGYYTPPIFEEEPIKFEKILSQSEIEAALLLEKMQRTCIFKL